MTNPLAQIEDLQGLAPEVLDQVLEAVREVGLSTEALTASSEIMTIPRADGTLWDTPAAVFRVTSVSTGGVDHHPEPAPVASIYDSSGEQIPFFDVEPRGDSAIAVAPVNGSAQKTFTDLTKSIRAKELTDDTFDALVNTLTGGGVA